VPLPEGSSYLKFIFARAKSPGAAEEALRAAYGKLDFVIAAEDQRKKKRLIRSEKSSRPATGSQLLLARLVVGIASRRVIGSVQNLADLWNELADGFLDPHLKSHIG